MNDKELGELVDAALLGCLVTVLFVALFFIAGSIAYLIFGGN